MQEAIDKNDMATLKTKLDALEQAANAMAEAMYKQQQADPNAANGSTNSGSSNDDVVDADFSENKYSTGMRSFTQFRILFRT